jgi:type I restriction enzyme, S subunit
MSEPRYWGGDVPWISPKVMTAIHADEADAHVTEGAIGNGTRLAPAGSTLVMVRGMGLHEGVRVSQARRAVTFNQDVKALVGSSIDSTLLFFALLQAQSLLLDRVESAGHGTGKLPSEVLLAVPIVMPDRPTQHHLSEPLRVMNDRIAAARDESRALAALRDTLLPKLISGERRATHANARSRETEQ